MATTQNDRKEGTECTESIKVVHKTFLILAGMLMSRMRLVILPMMMVV